MFKDVQWCETGAEKHPVSMHLQIYPRNVMFRMMHKENEDALWHYDKAHRLLQNIYYSNVIYYEKYVCPDGRLYKLCNKNIKQKKNKVPKWLHFLFSKTQTIIK